MPTYKSEGPITTYPGGWYSINNPVTGKPVKFVDPYGNQHEGDRMPAELGSVKPNAEQAAAPWEGSPEQNPNQARPGVDDRVWGNIAQPSAYEYGGQRGTAESEQERYAGLARAADTRFGPRIEEGLYGRQYGTDRGLDVASRDQQLQGLGQQQYGLSRLQDTIEGRGPSVAQQQQYAGLANAMQQQASIAASARGGGANLAFAQQQAAQNAANLSGNAVQQSALLRAQEQTAALQQYGSQAQGYSGAVAGMRGQDQARAGQSAQLAGQQAAINMQNKQTNDARNLAYEQMRRGVFQDQMGARQAGEAMNQGIYQQNADRAARADQSAAEERSRMISGVTSATGALVGTFVAPGPGTAAGAALGKTAGDAVTDRKSDVRAKKDIVPAGANLDQTMDAMGSYTYRYKDPHDGAGMQVGTMAQQMAETPLGRNVVARGRDGHLVIKGGEATSLALAGLARVNERLRSLEGGASGKSYPALEQAFTGAPGTSYPADARDVASESALARASNNANLESQRGYTETRPMSVGSDTPGAEQINRQKYADYVSRISNERRPVTAGEYETIRALPSTPEVDLFRQRPEFAGYGNVEGYEAPLPAAFPALAKAQQDRRAVASSRPVSALSRARR